MEVLGRAAEDIEEDVMFEGHLSHLLRVDLAVVLRCSPKVLKERLEAKGWRESKIMENVEAEAVDVILVEALDAVPFGHKVAARDIPAGEPVLKYSEAIGRASKEIKRGEHVHVHNVHSAVQGGRR